MDVRRTDLKREIEWLLRDKYAGRITPAAQGDLARLKKGEHVSYLIGWAPFLDCHIDLSARPLIPRPETEYWTEKVIQTMQSGSSKPRVLDIFCGSGCVGMAVMKYVPLAHVDFADIEEGYFKGIRRSLRMNNLTRRRPHFTRSNIFAGITGHYDYILANPPYIPTSGRLVRASVLNQEPRRALFGGKDGLHYIRAILREGKRRLRPGGLLVLEFDPPQKNAISTYAHAHGWKTEFSRDQHHRWRFAYCTSSGI